MENKYVNQRESDIRWEYHKREHEKMENALDIAFVTANARIDEAVLSHDKVHSTHSEAHDREHEMANVAILKAETTMDKRLEGMNQFREQLNFQTQSFLTRQVFEKYQDDLDTKIEVALTSLADKNEALIKSLVNRHDSDYNSLRESLQGVKDNIQGEREIRKAFEGSINTWKWIVGFLGASGVAGVILLFATSTSP